jgi:hypothetical protein
MPDSKGFIGKVFSGLFLFAVLMWVVKDPDQASTFANSAIAFIQRVLVGLLNFLNRVTS